MYTLFARHTFQCISFSIFNFVFNRIELLLLLLLFFKEMGDQFINEGEIKQTSEINRYIVVFAWCRSIQVANKST